MYMTEVTPSYVQELETTEHGKINVFFPCVSSTSLTVLNIIIDGICKSKKDNFSSLLLKVPSFHRYT